MVFGVIDLSPGIVALLKACCIRSNLLLLHRQYENERGITPRHRPPTFEPGDYLRPYRFSQIPGCLESPPSAEASMHLLFVSSVGRHRRKQYGDSSERSPCRIRTKHRASFQRPYALHPTNAPSTCKTDQAGRAVTSKRPENALEPPQLLPTLFCGVCISRSGWW